MAEQEAAAAEGQPKAGKNKNMIMGIVVLTIMLLEGGGIFVAMKMMGSDPAGADAAVSEQGVAENDKAEVLVVKLKPSNISTGSLYLWDIEIHAVIAKDDAESVTKMLEERAALIEDRLATVIRNARHNDLLAPGLETIKRQLGAELSKIVGNDEVIEEILIPTCTPFRADY